jgi:N4-(beta-N-acetylglucosaminyl)-L-asparaginase
MDRRKLIKLGVLGGLSTVVQPTNIKANENLSLYIPDLKKPIVISTWIHGLEANKMAWETLRKNGKAIDAIENGLKVTESDVTNRSVGIGGLPDAEGHVTLDACIMDENSRCGSVAYLEGIAHPISVARKIMESTQHVMLVGEGAKKFALKNNFEKISTPIPESKLAYEKWLLEQKEVKKPQINHENHDTIGMLVMDVNGNICGGCTTSGWAYKLPGRVGDSPIIGAGLFVDNEIGGAVATGLGEAIIRVSGSHLVVELMRQGKTPNEACKLAVERIISKHKNLEGLQCGFLAINKAGEVGAYSVFNGFNYAFTNANSHEMIDAKFNRKW